jgi:hypothetical protein
MPKDLKYLTPEVKRKTVERSNRRRKRRGGHRKG